MILQLVRNNTWKQYTEGKLYLDGVYFCDTLEDTDRGLDQSMSEFEIKRRKIYGQTCIPSGEYKVILNMSPRFKKILPRILDVKGFEGILMHAGNTVQDSSGCILLGTKSSDGVLINSRKAVNALIEKIKDQKDITIIIDYADYGKEN